MGYFMLGICLSLIYTFLSLNYVWKNLNDLDIRNFTKFIWLQFLITNDILYLFINGVKSKNLIIKITYINKDTSSACKIIN